MDPVTFTDDVAPVMPSSLPGPLQIVDPEDYETWIKIDPAGASIDAAAGARPIRRIVVPFARVYPTATASTIGLTMTAHYVSSITNGGFYAAPFPIPEDMDLTAPSSVYVLAASLTASTQTGPVVRLVLTYSYGQADEVPTDDNVTYDWTAPDSWAADSPKTVLIDDGNGRTFAPNLFEAGDQLGLRLARLGTATEDTFDKSVKFAERLVFEYTAVRF